MYRRSAILHACLAMWLVAHPNPIAAGGADAPAAIETPAQGEAEFDTNPPAPLSQEQQRRRSFLSDFEHWLTLVILAFGALVLLAEYLLLRDARKSSYELMQLFAVNLIITGTLVLISAGYSAEQIAPAFGLFGTIAGYLLGRRTGGAVRKEGDTR